MSRYIKGRNTGLQLQHLSGLIDAGSSGIANDGLVEIRDRTAVGLAERRELEKVVKEENSDRSAVYREIAVANGHPEWESDIRETFGRQWVANAKSGWYYQDDSGSWVQK